MNHNLSEKWIKSSVIGTIWAASEIVLGSFLHNLNIPFSGNFLTAIGIIILISISYLWPDKGLFWRAGLICAIMKTMSPSAVIFGPMIAIFAESVLLEMSVRLLGRTIAGYATGAMLAMSWNLFQKIFSYIIYYGSGIIDVYTNLLRMAQKQLNIQTDIVWLPIIILLVVYALFGLFAAIIGIRVGRKMLKQPAAEAPGKSNTSAPDFFHAAGHDFSYSVTWLIMDVCIIIASFVLLSYTRWYIWSLVITLVVIVLSFRYKRAFRQLKKPKFWIFFVVITLATAFVFTRAVPGESSWQKALLTGIQMNFRAVVIIVGFSALGTELYNPAVRNFFHRTAFKNLPLAIELSVESLPSFIATIPDFRSLIKNPVAIFYNVLSHAGQRFSEIRERKRKIFIITGPRGAGKTIFTQQTIDFLKESNMRASGILAIRIMAVNETKGYRIRNVETGEETDFLTIDEERGTEKIGKFHIIPEGYEKGKKILQSLVHGRNRLVVIDETGLLEVKGGGWAENLDELVKKSNNNLLLVVRDEFRDKVIERFNLQEAVVLNILEIDHILAGKMIYEATH